MDVAKLLKPDSVHCGLSARSKKHALELLSQALAASSEAANAEEILEGLIQRERLGCTGLGRSVAMPHTRLSGIDQSVGAFLRLDDAVDFDSVDGAPVDLLFGLLVPEEVSSADDIDLGVTEDGDAVEFNLHLAKSFMIAAIDLDFDKSIPGLGLDIDASLEMEVTFDFVFGVGFSLSDGRSLDCG